MAHAPHFVDDHLLRIGDNDFHCEHPIAVAPSDRFPVAKPRWLVEDYLELCGRLQPKRIMEIGVLQGGSTVLLSELTAPEKLVSIELSPEPVALLTDYIEARGLTEVVRPYFGVDQADRKRVAAIARNEFAGRPLDLVIDDASHRYAPSMATFETLFPLVRPGGLYLLEDWRWAHQFADAMASAPSLPKEVLEEIAKHLDEVASGRAQDEEPMSRLVLELVLARASGRGAVAEITIGSAWAAVLRGDDPLDPDTFRVTELGYDHFGLLRPIA
jgi:predicted O-methyltransferase YrrM